MLELILLGFGLGIAATFFFKLLTHEMDRQEREEQTDWEPWDVQIGRKPWDRTIRKP